MDFLQILRIIVAVAIALTGLLAFVRPQAVRALPGLSTIAIISHPI